MASIFSQLNSKNEHTFKNRESILLKQRLNYKILHLLGTNIVLREEENFNEKDELQFFSNLIQKMNTHV